MAGRRERILRVAVVRDGVIARERLVPRGEAVAAGDGAKDLPIPDLPSGTVLFEPTAEGWALRAEAGVEGRIARGEERIPAAGRVPLTDQDRGKLQVGSATVLFQHVEPPRARPVGPVRPGEFRPRILEEGDPVFVGFLTAWTALGVVLAALAWTIELPEPSLDEPPAGIVRLVPRPPAPPAPAPVVAPAPPVEAPPTRVAERPSEAPRGGDAPTRKRGAIEDSPLLAVFGTHGDARRGVVEKVWTSEEEGLGKLDEILKQANGATTTPSAETRTGRAGGTGAADDVEIDGFGGGGAADVGIAVEVKASVSAGTGSVAAIGDAAMLRQTVERNARGLQFCYEKVLKSSPKLEGRIEVAWSLEGGKVVGAHVVADTSGSADLAECVTRKIRSWTFPADVEGDLSWPFVFQPK